jgi:hypothetical protein
MADALGLVNKTQQGYQQAAVSESDPSPADIQASLDVLAGHRIDVLIYNTQTEGRGFSTRESTSGPPSGPGEVLIKAEAIGVNFVDIPARFGFAVDGLSTAVNPDWALGNL